jgi:Arc/MetJ-type ribon-helix-helix transcriptional regulator
MTTTQGRQTRSVTIGFSIPEADQSRLDHLVQVFSAGNRSAFLRMAMDRMETADRAQRLRNLQGYGAQRTAAHAISPDEISDRVKRVLARRAGA